MCIILSYSQLLNTIASAIFDHLSQVKNSIINDRNHKKKVQPHNCSLLLLWKTIFLSILKLKCYVNYQGKKSILN